MFRTSVHDTIGHLNSFSEQLITPRKLVSWIGSRCSFLLFSWHVFSFSFTQIDVWSAGCVLAELLLGEPIFPGASGVDQLVEIIKVLGTPTKEQIREMNRNYTEFKFPQIKAHPWTKVFRSRTNTEAIDLVSKLLEYTPTARMSPLQACAHPFFNELREPGTQLPTGRELPPLFNFTPEGSFLTVWYIVSIFFFVTKNLHTQHSHVRTYISQVLGLKF